MPQALITTPQGSLDPNKIPASTLKSLSGVSDIVPLTTADVVLQSARNLAAGVMLGVDPQQHEPLANYLVNVDIKALAPGSYNIILGEKLAGQLGLNAVKHCV